MKKPNDKTYRVPQLVMRMVRERTLPLTRESVSCGADAAALVTPMIGDLPTERLVAILIDGRSHVTGVVTVAQGGMHGMGVRAADILRAVLAGHASGFVLAHNHPSNDPCASREDVELTRKVANAARVLGCPLLDHVIVTRSGGFTSIPFPEGGEDDV